MSDYNNNLNDEKKSILSINTNQIKNNIKDIIEEKSRMKMVYSNSMDNILKNDDKWGQKIHNYYLSKKNIKWCFNPNQKIISAKNVKYQDLAFNPITQRYTDKKFDLELKKQEQSNLKQTIAQSYDKELKVIKIFDIINLKNRFEFYKNNRYQTDNFLEDKTPKFRKINIPSAERNYNILSNISLNLHHYDKPENRPIIKKSNNNNKNCIRNIDYFHLKDYDIISNKYKYFDKEKKNIDKQLALYKSSKKYLNERDYDPIKGIYISEEKEQKYLENTKSKMVQLKNAKRESLVNPFINHIYNKEKFTLLNQKLDKKIYRYSLKPKIEEFYRQKDLTKDILKNNSLKTKIQYNRFKEIDHRGNDILNGNDNYNYYKNSISCRNMERPLEKIMKGVNENQTIKDKELYLCYDPDDVNKRFKKNKMKIKNMMKNLRKIEDEKILPLQRNMNDINNENLFKRNNSEIFNNIYKNSEKNKNSFNSDKNLWFSTEKNVYFEY